MFTTPASQRTRSTGAPSGSVAELNPLEGTFFAVLGTDEPGWRQKPGRMRIGEIAADTLKLKFEKTGVRKLAVTGQLPGGQPFALEGKIPMKKPNAAYGERLVVFVMWKIPFVSLNIDGKKVAEAKIDEM